MAASLGQPAMSDPFSRSPRPPAGAELLRDCLFLGAVVVLSLVTYVGSLGFYSDDWSFLGWLSVAKEPTLTGLYRSINAPNVQMRPAAIFYLALDYFLFGHNPLGYQLLNGVLLVAAVLLFYLALRELELPRLLALAVPAVYALLPHYSTIRVWAVASSITLMLAAYFLSLFADLRAVRSRGPRLAAWKLLSVAALVVSVLAYELALPLFVLNAGLVWYLGRRRRPPAERHVWLPSRELWLALGTVAPLVPLAAFKLATTVRLPHGGPADALKALLRRAVVLHYGEYDFGFNLWRAIRVAFGTYGLGLPRVAARALRDYPDPATMAVAVVAGALVFLYLRRVAGGTGGVPDRRVMGLMAVAGVVVFGLGYAIFLTNWNVGFSPAGIINRTAAAAAIGVALVFVGLAGYASTWLRSDRLRRLGFAGTVALLCGTGTLINDTIAAFWVAAYAKERSVLQDIRQAFPSVQPESTLILDGVCPYDGPAIVFESAWDLAGALLLHYGDYTVQADVVTPRLAVGEDGLDTSLYGAAHHYPYGRLFVYNATDKTVHRLRTAEDARRYFIEVSPDRGRRCPSGHEGYGARIF